MKVNINRSYREVMPRAKQWEAIDSFQIRMERIVGYLTQTVGKKCRPSSMPDDYRKMKIRGMGSFIGTMYGVGWRVKAILPGFLYEVEFDNDSDAVMFKLHIPYETFTN